MGGCCAKGGKLLGDTKEPVAIFTPNSQRGCTDILFLLLYLISWGGLISCVITAAGRGGSPSKIYHGVDYYGNVCGGAARPDEPYNAWITMSLNGKEDCTGCFYIRQCVNNCGYTAPSVINTTNKYFVDQYLSESFLYYCIPSPSNAGGIQVNVSFSFSGDFQSASEMASRAIADLYTVWPVILISAGIALILSYIYNWLAERYAGVLVLFAIVLILAGGFLASYSLLKSAQDAKDSPSGMNDRDKAMYGVGITLAVCTVIFFFVVIAMRVQIQIAIEIIKEAARAIEDMPLLTFFPFFPLILGLGYFVIFIVVSLYIFSVWNSEYRPMPEHIVNSDVYKNQNFTTQIINGTSYLVGNNIPPFYFKYSWDESLKRAFAYAFFHLLWSVQFLIYYCYMVIAGAIANWYFTPRDQKGEKIRGNAPGQLSTAPIADSCYRTTRFHMGTIALGALIIAIIQFIRAVVAYLEKKAYAQGEPNFITKCIFCFINCCLYCMQCCLDKINKNAFVWTAVWGDSFGTAACSSFKLIWGNLGRTGAMSVVSSFIMFVGKVLVALATCGICAIVMKSIYKNLNSLVLPVIIIFILAYMVASLFMLIFETTMDTIFLCFLIDEKCNKAAGTMLASEGLKQLVEKNGDRCDKYAKQQYELNSKREAHLGVTHDGTAPAQNNNVGTTVVVPPK